MLRILTVLLLLLSAATQAQEVRYVSDTQLIPLRSGPGNQYRVTHRGIPSGTRLTVARVSQDGVFSEITTDRGTTGWIRTQYLMSEVPARNKLAAALASAEQTAQKQAQLEQELSTLQAERADLLNQLTGTGGELDSVSDELAALKEISDNAVQLDQDNRRLVEEVEILKSDLDKVRADNQRLQDNIDSEAFLNGALAVLLGVMITLLVPRLWPQRRKSSSWA